MSDKAAACPHCGAPVEAAAEAAASPLQPAPHGPDIPSRSALRRPPWVLIVGGGILLALFAVGAGRAARNNRAGRTANPAPRLVTHPSSCPAGRFLVGSDGTPTACTGPSPIEMSWRQAEAYLSKNGYPISESSPRCAPSCTSYRGADATLRGNKANELIVFEYTSVNDDSPPLCVSVVLDSGDWRKIITDITGMAARSLPEPALGVAGCSQQIADTISCRFDGRSAHGRTVPLQVQLSTHPPGAAALNFGTCPSP